MSVVERVDAARRAASSISGDLSVAKFCSNSINHNQYTTKIAHREAAATHQGSLRGLLRWAGAHSSSELVAVVVQVRTIACDLLVVKDQIGDADNHGDDDKAKDHCSYQLSMWASRAVPDNSMIA